MQFSALGPPSDLGDTPQRRRWAEQLQQLVEVAYPSLGLDWAKILHDIGGLIDVLPDEPPESAPHGCLEQAVCALVKAVLEDAHSPSDRAALRVVRDLIDETEQADPERLHTDPFGWRAALGTPTVPPPLSKHVAAMRVNGRIEDALAACRLMSACYPGDPSGHLLSGVLHMEQGQVARAEEHLERARQVAREQFPARRPKSHYWASHRGDPWIEATIELAQCRTALGRYEEALELLDELRAVSSEQRHGAGVQAAVELCRGAYDTAIHLAEHAASMAPRWSLVAALAHAKLGRQPLALARLLHALLDDQAEVKHTLTAIGTADGSDAPCAGAMASMLARFADEHPGLVAELTEYLKAPQIREAVELTEEASRAGDARRLCELRSFEHASSVAASTLGASVCDARDASSGHQAQGQRWRVPLANAEHIPVDEHGLPFDCPWSLPAVELEPREQTGDLPPFVAMIAMLPRSFQVACSNVGRNHVDVCRYSHPMPALVLKTRRQYAKRMARRVGRWCRFRWEGAGTIVLELLDNCEVQLELQATEAELLKGALADDPRLLVLCQGGGTLRKRDRVSLSDVVSFTHGLQRSPLTDLDFTHYEVEVRLDHVAPKVWRSLLIRADSTFLGLHDAIQLACGWTDSHLFRFHERERWQSSVATAPFEPEPDEQIAPDVEIWEHFEHTSSCHYVYDFGDSWEHEVRLLARRSVSPAVGRRLLGGARAFPPEDAGGLLGYGAGTRQADAMDIPPSTLGCDCGGGLLHRRGPDRG